MNKKVVRIGIVLIVLILAMISISLMSIKNKTWHDSAKMESLKIEGTGTTEEPWNISATSSDNVTAILSDDGTLTISGTGNMKDFEASGENVSPWDKTKVKNVIIEQGVKNIGDGAFSRCEGLTSIKIPDDVTSIGRYTFSGCIGLTSIEIPNGLTRIEMQTFASCKGLTSIEIPNSVKSIEYQAFWCCTGLTSIEIPNSVTKIESAAFYGCKGLTSIKIPNSVTSIGDSAFWGCTGLTSMEISNGITSIEKQTFCGCTGLTKIEIPNSVTSIGEDAFWGCTGLTSMEIPNSVTSIGGSAFYGCKGLTSIEIPNNVTSIGEGAFEVCTKLESINVNRDNTVYSSEDGILFNKNKTSLIKYPEGKLDKTEYKIPDSVTSIISRAFNECTGLTRIEIPDSVTSIGERAFFGCTGLTSIEIPNNVTNIGKLVFYRCKALTRIEIPDSVTSISERAFDGCKGLTSIEIPNSVTSIGDSAFRECTVLTIYTYEDAEAVINYATQNSIPYKIIKGKWDISATSSDNVTAILSDNGTLTISGTGNMKDFESSGENVVPWDKTKVKNVIIEQGVNNIGKRAFYQCTNLTSIEISNSVTSIGSYAFDGCIGLTSIKIPDGVVSIDSFTFIGCTKLTSIEIPNSVITIRDFAFRECTGLTSIEIPSSVEWISPMAFVNCPKLESINVNKDNTAYSSEDGILFSEDKTWLCKYPEGKLDKTEYKIPDIVTGIDMYAFFGCKGLTNIKIPSRVEYIEVSVFYECTGLTSIEIPSSVTSIKDNAFFGCKGLTSIEIPSSVTSIEGDAFNGCTGLTIYTYEDAEVVINYATENSIPYNILIEVPTVPQEKTYNTKEQNHGIKIPTNTQIVEGNSVLKATNVGEYQIELQLTDTTKYVWKDRTTTNKIIKWKINPYDLSTANIADIGNKSYTGKQILPEPEVKVTMTSENDTTLLKDIDFTYSYGENKNLGKGTVKITGKGNYIGEKEIEFMIVKSSEPGSVPTGIVAIYGDKLKDIELPSGFSWEDSGDTVVGEDGRSTFNVTYTPEDQEHYEILTGIEVKIKIIKINDYISKDGDNRYIERISPGTTVKQIKENIQINDGTVEINVYRDGTKIEETEKVATGMNVKITVDSKEFTYQIAVTGDIYADGQVDGRDLLKLARYLVGLDTEKMTKIDLKATDVHIDGLYADPADLLKLSRLLIGLD